MQPVVLITGGGRGLGSALALNLAQAGCRIALHCHASLEGAVQTRQAILAGGGEAEVFQADLRRQAEAERLAAAVCARLGQIDVLINNAGVYQPKAGLALSEAEWFEGLDTTVTPAYFTTRACLPAIRRSQRKRIINIGDSACDHPGARDMAWSYHVGKTGVWILTRSLAETEAPHGVAVNMVSPGYLANSLDLPPAHTLPAGCYGQFADTEPAVRFLALDAPAYLTGSNLVVSGGWNL